jgi:hypothetical protein
VRGRKEVLSEGFETRRERSAMELGDPAVDKLRASLCEINEKLLMILGGGAKRMKPNIQDWRLWPIKQMGSLRTK